MAKWALLRSMVERGRDPAHGESIHAAAERFSFQFDDASKSRALWEGFVLRVALPVGDLASVCREHIVHIDCPVFVLELSGAPGDDLEGLLVTTRDASLSLVVRTLSETASGFCATIDVTDAVYSPQCASFQLHRYSLPDPLGRRFELFTREPAARRKVRAEDVLSNRLYGVDNTGNICVWPCETLLLSVLTASPRLRALVAGAALLEIGGGATGLAGLGAACALGPREVLLTDGHPHAARNQRVCLEMCRSRGSMPDGVVVDVQHMPWGTAATTLPAQHFDVVVGADCLFFTDFHNDLLALLRHALRPRTGRAVLLQPRRSTSMDQFVELAREAFDVTVEEDYLPQVSERRATFLASGDATYNEDLHFPVLVLLAPKQPVEPSP